jgi:hypothetical protein
VGCRSSSLGLFCVGFLYFFVSFSVMCGPLGNRGLVRAVGVVGWLSVWVGKSVAKGVMYVGEILAGAVCAPGH